MKNSWQCWNSVFLNFFTVTLLQRKEALFQSAAHGPGGSEKSLNCFTSNRCSKINSECVTGIKWWWCSQKHLIQRTSLGVRNGTCLTSVQVGFHLPTNCSAVGETDCKHCRLPDKDLDIWRVSRKLIRYCIDFNFLNFIVHNDIEGTDMVRQYHIVVSKREINYNQRNFLNNLESEKEII